MCSRMDSSAPEILHLTLQRCAHGISQLGADVGGLLEFLTAEKLSWLTNMK